MVFSHQQRKRILKPLQTVAVGGRDTQIAGLRLQHFSRVDYGFDRIAAPAAFDCFGEVEQNTVPLSMVEQWG